MMYLDWGKNKIEICTWAALGSFLVLYFFSLYYTDIYITYDNSMILMDCIRDGKILNFYEISAQQNTMGTGAVYFISVYIIFLIWNLPIWVLTRFLGVSIGHTGCLLWSKGLLIVFTAGSIWLLYRIFKKMEYKNFEFSLFIFLSSLFFICPSLAACQYDIIEIFFMLYAIYFYLEDENLSWRSLLLFSAAVSVKLFAIFPFIMLILIIEKRILNILFGLGFVFLFNAVVMLPWYSGYKQAAGPFNQNIMASLFENSLPGGIADISIFALGFFALCIIAYLIKPQDIQHCFRMFTWLSFAFFLLFFSFVSTNPYWIILFLPFIIFLLADNKKNIRVNMILEIVMEGTMILVQGVRFYWVYFNEGAFARLLFKDSGVREGFTTISDILTWLGLYSWVPAFYAAFAICGIALLAINNPWKAFSEEITDNECMAVEKSTRCLKSGLVALYILLTYVVAYH